MTKNVRKNVHFRFKGIFYSTITGGSVLGNVSSVHQNEKFLGMVNLLSSYGFLSDMFTRAEEDFRWLGKLRYMWSCKLFFV